MGHVETSVQIGYKPRHPTLPNVDQCHPTFPQATAVLTIRSQAGVVSAALHQQVAAIGATAVFPEQLIPRQLGARPLRDGEFPQLRAVVKRLGVSAAGEDDDVGRGPRSRR